MSDFLKSFIRDAVQKLLGIAFAWLGVHALALPAGTKAAVTNWAILAVTAGLLLVWTGLVRFLETRKGDSELDRVARAVGRVLMLGIGSTPTYSTPAATPAAPPAAPPAS